MIDLITSQKYLDGKLEGKELESFESDLSNNQDLVDELNLIKEIDESLSDIELYNFEIKVKKGINEYMKENSTSQKKIIRLFYNKYSIAASIIFLIGFISFIVSYNQIPGNNQYFAQYYQKYENDIIKRSDTSSEDLYVLAIENYNNGEYEKSIMLFQQNIIEGNNSNASNFYSGLCYMELYQYQKALSCFSETNITNNLIKIHSQWYTALSYLKLNKIEKAKNLLKVIIEDNKYYKEKAAELLQKLQ